MATLIGTAGNDTLVGTPFDDFISGLAGADSLIGGSGNDSILGSTGADRIQGNDGDDTISAGTSPGTTSTNRDRVAGGSGSDAFFFDVDPYSNAGFVQIADFAASVDKLVLDRVVFPGLSAGPSLQPAEFASAPGLTTAPTAATRIFYNETDGSVYYDQDGSGSAQAPRRIALLAPAAPNLPPKITINDFIVYSLDQLIIGTPAPDSLTGGSGNDTILGLGSDDTLTGLAGNDILDGGSCEDTANYSYASLPVIADLTGFTMGAAGATVVGALSSDIDSFVSIENLYGGSSNDTLIGSDEANLIEGVEGNDSILGYDGHDTLIGGGGNDFLDGATGDDDIVGGFGNDTLVGFLGADVIVADSGNDQIDGGADSDTIDGGDGDDTIFGGDGDDSILGGLGNDSVFGGDGADTIIAGDGSDTVDGGAGDDSISGGVAADSIRGGFGADVIYGDAGADRLAGGDDNDIIFGGADSDTILGEAGDDRLDGGDGNDSIVGGLSDDFASGGDGNDRIQGNDGNDTINGGTSTGKDPSDPASANGLSGGAGDDTFLFNTPVSATYSRISDFNTSGADNITLDRTVFAALTNGSSLSPSELRVGTSFTNTSQRIRYNSSTGDLFYDVDGSGAAPSVLFATLVSKPTITAGMFKLVNGQVILGTLGPDSLVGGAGSDSIFGLGGDDTLTGGVGNDSIDGGDGVNTVSYTYASAPVILNLAIGMAVVSAGDADVLTLIDNAVGSSSADILAGDQSTNMLYGVGGGDSLFGAAGDDLLSGGLGNDTLNGGDGNDAADYTYAVTAVQATLEYGVGGISGSPSDADVYVSIENLIGGSGNDSLYGSTGSNTMSGAAGNDLIFGEDNLTSTLLGGTSEDFLFGNQGNDSLLGGGGNFSNKIYGDDLDLSGTAVGGNDQIGGGYYAGNPALPTYQGVPINGNVLYGDADTIAGSARGGNDSIVGGDGSYNDFLIGDAWAILDNGRGGDDDLVGGLGTQYVSIVGDAQNEMRHGALGGDDFLVGSPGDLGTNRNLLIGDTYYMFNCARGGNDTLQGGALVTMDVPGIHGMNAMYGDAVDLVDAALAGNDLLVGGIDATNFMVGDAYQLGSDLLVPNAFIPLPTDAPTGGNDTLVGGAGPGAYNLMLGDAVLAYGAVQMGDDVLFSGLNGAQDEMYGDVDPYDIGGTDWLPGYDTFVFEDTNGADIIGDFQDGYDLIQLSITGYPNFASLALSQVDGTNTLITFTPNDSITVWNTWGPTGTTLKAGNFLFVPPSLG